MLRYAAILVALAAVAAVPAHADGTRDRTLLVLATQEFRPEERDRPADPGPVLAVTLGALVVLAVGGAGGHSHAPK